MFSSTLARWPLLLIAYVVVYALWTLEHWGGIRVTAQIGGTPLILPSLIATLVVFWRSQQEQDARTSRGWLTLAVATGMYTAGMIFWGYHTVVYQRIPFPTMADALFLLFPWFMFAALVQLTGTRLEGLARVKVITNTVIMLFSLGLIEWSVLLRHTVKTADSVLAAAAAVLYPLGDLVMLGGVVFILQYEWQRERRSMLWLILGGVLVFALGNIIYTVEVARGTYTAGSPLDLTWATGLTLFTFAALKARSFVPVPAGTRTTREETSSNLILFLKFGAYAALAPLMLARDTGIVDTVVALLALFGLGYFIHSRDRIGRLENQALDKDLLQANTSLIEANTQLNERVRDAVSTLEVRNTELGAQSRILEQQNLKIQTTSDVADLLQACLTLDEARTVLLRAAATIFPGTRGSIATINSSRNLIESFVQWSEAPTSTAEQVFAPSECWALRRGHPHSHERDGSRVSIPCLPLGREVPAAYLCVPLVAQGETVGVFRLQTEDKDPQALQGMNEAVQSMARHVALALANLRLRESLRLQSIRDPLTGLHNRRYLEETLEREVRRAIRGGLSISVLVLDIDHFKKFNDSFGHDAGDGVLKELAGLMQRVFREEDIVCRYGGEEFLIALLDADEAQAMRRAEHLRQAVEGLTVLFQHQPLGTITISVGVAALSEQRSKPADLIQAADQALYRAKKQGRNQVLAAAADPTTGTT
ncbi:diguanylate cyclase [Deinococcus sp. QL22]|uniref:GGDEF domain-containing protein n=1 Tax=Deinococcus sp. QL22 TaxID=2939437 RepID=UPI0020172C15|nr:diguanylate cyclase [Deinococcus sp. QL22]UQN09218.1 diguanylate cyclase [Deinococcus sp. QL22]